MKKSTLVAVAMMTLVGGAARSARAQGAAVEQPFFASVEIGAQPQQHTITASSSFPLYDETATISTEQLVHNGPVFGFFGGYRLTPVFGVAIGVTTFHARESDATATASIPDPVAFGQPKTVTATATGLKRSEVGVHLQAVWFHPVTDKIEIALSAGPSIIKVKQDLALNATVPPGTQNLTLSTTSESKNAFGFNAGFEGNYLFNPSFGLGLFLRYAGTSADLPSVQDLKVGGLQTGVGLRARF